MTVVFNLALEEVTLADLQCYTRPMEDGKDLVDVLILVFHIHG